MSNTAKNDTLKDSFLGDGIRMIPLDLSQEDIARVKRISNTRNHPAKHIAHGIERSVCVPNSPMEIDPNSLDLLIYMSLRLGDPEFTALVRDMVVIAHTQVRSFQAFLEAPSFKPKLEMGSLYQLFLSDEYRMGMSSLVDNN